MGEVRHFLAERDAAYERQARFAALERRQEPAAFGSSRSAKLDERSTLRAERLEVRLNLFNSRASPSKRRLIRAPAAGGIGQIDLRTLDCHPAAPDESLIPHSSGRGASRFRRSRS
jgi:hypothetical protein